MTSGDGNETRGQGSASTVPDRTGGPRIVTIAAVPPILIPTYAAPPFSRKDCLVSGPCWKGKCVCVRAQRESMRPTVPGGDKYQQDIPSERDPTAPQRRLKRRRRPVLVLLSDAAKCCPRSVGIVSVNRTRDARQENAMVNLTRDEWGSRVEAQSTGAAKADRGGVGIPVGCQGLLSTCRRVLARELLVKWQRWPASPMTIAPRPTPLCHCAALCRCVAADQGNASPAKHRLAAVWNTVT